MAEVSAGSWEETLIADMRANGGRPSMGPLAGQPLLIMGSTGARSGEPRRAILTYSRDGEAFVVAGTNDGAPADPAWVANLLANPNVTIEADGETSAGTAAFAEGPDRAMLWDRHVAALPWFALYPERAGREIKMIRLLRRRD